MKILINDSYMYFTKLRHVFLYTYKYTTYTYYNMLIIQQAFELLTRKILPNIEVITS